MGDITAGAPEASGAAGASGSGRIEEARAEGSRGGGGRTGDLDAAFLGAGGWFIAEVVTGALVGLFWAGSGMAGRGIGSGSGSGGVLYPALLCGIAGGLASQFSGTVAGIAAGVPIGVTARALGRHPLAAASVAVALGALVGGLEAQIFFTLSGPSARVPAEFLLVGAARGVAAGLAACAMAAGSRRSPSVLGA